MKKSLLLLLIIASVTSLSSCNKKKEPRKDLKIGIITDYRDVNEKSNIKTMFDLCVKWCNENNVSYSFRKPNYDRDENRETSIKILLDEGCNTIITLGSSFAAPINNVIEKFPYHKFIALDMSSDDMYNAHFNNYDFNKNNEEWSSYSIPSNLYLLNYRLEETSYALGYLLAKDDYKYINYVGNKNSIEVNRIGYSFVQGANDYAKEANKDITIRYAYTNYNNLDNDIVSRFITWNGIGEFNEKKVYLCSGGEVYKNALNAATKKGVENVKIISTNYDYYDELSDKYKEAYLGALVKDYGKYIPSYLDGILNDKVIPSGEKICPSSDYEQNYLDVSFVTKKWDFLITKDEYENKIKDALNGKNSFNKSLKDLPLSDDDILFQGNIKK